MGSNVSKGSRKTFEESPENSQEDSPEDSQEVYRGASSSRERKRARIE
ncbi:hypothetical protein PIIN_09740 [Serendipita indica DSM 11827]|uniref:Uncharacterized protein n=1 Tax=Serendipita indica (strain DSM 11827) TaxID=1109443 RepID=G4TWQ7_SERID|nr:hypothetical protein PIIN_09740 [Serendipita indica DSM 11827]